MNRLQGRYARLGPGQRDAVLVGIACLLWAGEVALTGTPVSVWPRYLACGWLALAPWPARRRFPELTILVQWLLFVVGGQVFMKLGVRDRAQAVVLAYEAGLVVPGEADEG